MTLLKKEKNKAAKPVAVLLILLAVSIVCEVFLFNFRYFLPIVNHAKHVVLTANDISECYSCKTSGKNIFISSDYAGFSIENISTPIYNIKLNLANCSGTFSVEIKYEDQNFSSEYLDAGTWTVDPYLPSTEYMSITSSGACKNIEFYLSDIADENFTITSIELNSPAFFFRLPRMLLLFLLLASVYLIGYFKPWKIKFNPFSRVQSLLYQLVVLVCLSITIFTFCVSVSNLSFYKEVPETHDNYQLLTQAFYHRQLSLLITPSQALKSLSNPYDYSLRSSEDVTYSFDTAYYKGKYYSYFGVAPVLTLLLPFKIMTGWYLPTSLACLVFTLITILSMLTLYRQMVRQWFGRINLMMFLFGEIAVVLCSNILWLISVPEFYELAFISASAFLFLALNMLFCTLNSRHTGAFLFLSGLFFALMVASRPNTIFFIALAAPFLISILRQKRGLAGTLSPLASFFSPLAAAGLGIMVYNYARFGSIFEFGARYQLTLSDVSYNKLTNISILFNGIFHYFFQPVSVTMEFPFFSVARQVSAQVTNYYFNIATAGLINFPLLLILFGSVYIIRRMPGKSAQKAFVGIAVMVSLIVIYVDIMVGGVTMRYSLDIYPILTFCALILWMEVYHYFSGKHAGAPITKLFAVVVAVTALISVNICVMGEDKRLMYYYPDIYYYLYDLFAFWN